MTALEYYHKGQETNAISLFRQGMFYEAYDSDAKYMYSLSGLALQRCDDWECKVAFPNHLLNKYIGMLAKKGRRIQVIDKVNNSSDMATTPTPTPTPTTPARTAPTTSGTPNRQRQIDYGFAKTEEIKQFINKYIGSSIRSLDVYMTGSIADISIEYQDFKPVKEVRRHIEDAYPNMVRIDKVERTFSEKAILRAVELMEEGHETIYVMDADGSLRPVVFGVFLEDLLNNEDLGRKAA